MMKYITIVLIYGGICAAIFPVVHSKTSSDIFNSERFRGRIFDLTHSDRFPKLNFEDELLAGLIIRNDVLRGVIPNFKRVVILFDNDKYLSQILLDWFVNIVTLDMYFEYYFNQRTQDALDFVEDKTIYTRNHQDNVLPCSIVALDSKDMNVLRDSAISYSMLNHASIYNTQSFTPGYYRFDADSVNKMFASQIKQIERDEPVYKKRFRDCIGKANP